jgi:hypothetical protein
MFDRTTFHLTTFHQTTFHLTNLTRVTDLPKASGGLSGQNVFIKMSLGESALGEPTLYQRFIELVHRAIGMTLSEQTYLRLLKSLLYTD